MDYDYRLVSQPIYPHTPIAGYSNVAQRDRRQVCWERGANEMNRLMLIDRQLRQLPDTSAGQIVSRKGTQPRKNNKQTNK